MHNRKATTYLLCLFILQSICATNCHAQTRKTNSVNKNIVSEFFNSYVFREENQIFLDKKYGVFFTYGIALNRDDPSTIKEHFEKYYINENVEYPFSNDLDTNINWPNRHRMVGITAIYYAVPDKIMHVNGRMSIGLFNWHGLTSEYNKRFGALGIEFIQEFIFGAPMLYITAGVGPAYVFEIPGYNKHMNMASQFFFTIIAKIGHRFDNGMAVEIGWKHYSNGRLRVPNVGLDTLALTIGYTF